MAADQFKMLFSPGKIGNLEMKNRIVVTSHETNYCYLGGEVSQRFIDYYVAKAKGGAGWINAEAAIVDEGRSDFPRGLSIYDDRFIPGLRKLTEAVHKYDTKIGSQIAHFGRQTDPAVSVKPLEAPSPIPCPLMQTMPEEMTTERVQEVVKLFGQAARRAKDAGFDLVEIHGAHGYLICEFLSAYSNKRTDQYGGSLENRARFALEVIAEVRKQVGPDYPVGIRISAEEWVDGGLTLAETTILAKWFAEAGVAYINVSNGNYSFPGLAMGSPTMNIPAGSLAWLAAAIREAVDIPVVAVGRINQPALAEKILEDGSSDFVAMTSALIADPELPNKAKEGRLEDIRGCIGCNQGCLDRLFDRLDISCQVNPEAGRERELAIKPADKKKKVVIIGGGPAGLECARVSAMRGHEVILYDDKSELGGMNLYACKLPGRDEMREVSNYLERQVRKLNVKINLSQKATAETVKAEQCDAVVVAIGASFIIPQIKGARRPDGRLAENVLTPIEVLDNAPVGQNVVVYGAGAIAIETAVYLSERGKKVVMVENSGGVVQNMYGNLHWLCSVLPKMQEQGIELLPSKIIVEIRPGEVVVDTACTIIKDIREGIIVPGEDTVKVPADTVVLAVGRKSNDGLMDQLIGLVPEVYSIGDCVEPSLCGRATRDGAMAGRQI